MTVTLFGDMADEGKMKNQDFDRIYDKRLKVRYATLREPHLFIQYSGEFTPIERWKWDQFHRSYVFEGSWKFAEEYQTDFYWGSR